MKDLYRIHNLLDEGVKRELRRVTSGREPKGDQQKPNYTKGTYGEAKSQKKGGKGSLGTKKDHQASDTTKEEAAAELEKMEANRGVVQRKIAPSVKSTDQRKSAVAEGSGSRKRLERKEKAFKKGARKSQDSEFDWKPRSGESGDDIVARTTVARKEGEALHKKRLANASRLGRKKAEGEGRASTREFGVGKYAPTKETHRQSEIQRRVAANREKKVT